MVKIAETYFSFTADTEAQIEVIVGDGRASLEHEPANGFDILFLDAFSSDSTPVHTSFTENSQ